MYITVGETQDKSVMWLTFPAVHLGQARAKKASDLREYDVIITTHAVRSFTNPRATDSEFGD